MFNVLTTNYNTRSRA